MTQRTLGGGYVRGHYVDGSGFACQASFKGSARCRHQRHTAIANRFVVVEDLHGECGAALAEPARPATQPDPFARRRWCAMLDIDGAAYDDLGGCVHVPKHLADADRLDQRNEVARCQSIQQLTCVRAAVRQPGEQALRGLVGVDGACLFEADFADALFVPCLSG